MKETQTDQTEHVRLGWMVFSVMYETLAEAARSVHVQPIDSNGVVGPEVPPPSEDEEAERKLRLEATLTTDEMERLGVAFKPIWQRMTDPDEETR